MLRISNGWSVVLISVVAAAAGVTGCHSDEDDQKIRTSTQRNMAEMDAVLARGTPHLDQMADNALMHNLSICDFHFVAHSAELSGTGVARLDRMAPMLDTYGGVLRYETYSTDEALISKRMDHVREYLALAGCNMDRIDVKPAISGGRTTPASEAIKVMDKGTGKEQPGQNQPGGGMPMMPTSN